MRARHYSPSIGRFISEDSYLGEIDDPLSLNLYTYCHNDPINYFDPSGHADVMVAYIASKNGGSATYSESNFLGIGSWNQKVTVKIGDTTKVYTIGEKDSVAKIVNGKAVIDSEVLKTDFGLDDTQSTHQAGDKFDSADHAAMAFGMMYHQRSKDERQEYGAAIDRDSNGKYSFVNVSNSSMSAKDPNNMTDAERNACRISFTGDSVGKIHTHWRSDGNLNFSNPSDYKTNNPKLEFMYLVNRNGEVYYSSRSTKNNNIEGFSPCKKIFKIK